MNLQEYAKSLEEKNIPSEIWFKSLWVKIGYLDRSDEFNVPLGPYIPDLLNKKYKYVVEIDGSIHQQPEVKIKDKKKDLYFKGLGFTIFRVRAFKMWSFFLLIKKMCAYRRTKNPFFRKKKPGKKHEDKSKTLQNEPVFRKTNKLRDSTVIDRCCVCSREFYWDIRYPDEQQKKCFSCETDKSLREKLNYAKKYAFKSERIAATK